MKIPCYVDLPKAREILSEIGVNLTPRQMKRAADLDGKGQRKLPFFICPIEGKLKIEKDTLIEVFTNCQINAENNAQFGANNLMEIFDRKR
jgi:hypothetical protein